MCAAACAHWVIIIHHGDAGSADQVRLYLCSWPLDADREADECTDRVLVYLCVG